MKVIGGGPAGAIPELMKYSKDRKQRGSYVAAATPGNYATGGSLGDLQLSSNSFQVRGAPNTTDGNHYPQLNANLDHNEVVKTETNQSPFVFSNKLKMPNGKSFADAARKLELSTGRSEKVLKTNPSDPFARATIAHNENRSNILAQEQEALATAKGLRGPSRNFATGGYTGGPDDPSKLLDVSSYKPGMTRVFYDPTTELYYQLDANTNKLKEYLNKDIADALLGSDVTAKIRRDGALMKQQQDAASLSNQPSSNYEVTTTSGTPSMGNRAQRGGDRPLPTVQKTPSIVGDPNRSYTIPGQSAYDAGNKVRKSLDFREREVTINDMPGYQPAGNAGFIDMGRDGVFFDPYNKKFVVRKSDGSGDYVPVAPKPGEFSVKGNVVRDVKANKTFDVNQHLDSAKTLATPGGTNPSIPATQASGLEQFKLLTTDGLPSYGNQSVASSERPDIYGGIYDQPTGPLGSATNPYSSPSSQTVPGRGRSRTSISSTSKTTLPQAPFNTTEAEYDRALLEEMQAAGNRGDLSIYRGEYDEGPTEAGGIVTSPVTSTAAPRAMPDIASALNFGKSATGADGITPIADKFTVGDGLQAVEVLSKFAQLKGGPEKERPYYDNTNITKENFDPANALYQSQRNFQLGKNTLQNASINQNRSFTNNLYVGKLNQDSDIISKYNQMNQAATTQQEQRQADQRRYNIGQTTYTNDLNARNRGAYKNAIDTAFTSLGNFGQGLNDKKQGTDALNILRASYPEVYARIMKGIHGGK